MKTIENVTLYKCDFCKKALRVKKAMDRHEKFCGSNPNNHHACSNNCIHLIVSEIDILKARAYPEDSYTTHSKKFKCAFLKKRCTLLQLKRKCLKNILNN